MKKSDESAYMNNYTDIHSHILSGVDDGPSNEEKMKNMLRAAYKDGTRKLCFTPHYHPAIYGKNEKRSEAVFESLKAYAKEEFPDMELFLGNEMRYDVGYLNWMKENQCRTLNGTKHLLIDFSEFESATVIIKALESLLASGYIPVLAHVERYRKLDYNMGQVIDLAERGVIMQVDAQSVFGGWGFSSKVRSRKLIKMRLADVIASDAHNLEDRPPYLTKCYEYVVKKCGERYADAIFVKNPTAILENKKQ